MICSFHLQFGLLNPYLWKDCNHVSIANVKWLFHCVVLFVFGAGGLPTLIVLRCGTNVHVPTIPWYLVMIVEYALINRSCGLRNIVNVVYSDVLKSARFIVYSIEAMVSSSSTELYRLLSALNELPMNVDPDFGILMYSKLFGGSGRVIRSARLWRSTNFTDVAFISLILSRKTSWEHDDSCSSGVADDDEEVMSL